MILATYQRNLEVTEQKLVASQQENIDLHIQIKQLVQHSSKLQHQIKDLSAAASASGSNLLATSEVQQGDKAGIPPSSADASVPAAELLEQQKQYAAVFTLLTEQIKELKEQMRGGSTSSPGRILADSVAASATASKALLSTSSSTKGPVTMVDPLSAAEPASADVIEAVTAALNRPQSGSKAGHLSRNPTPPATPPPRKASSATAVGSGIGFSIGVRMDTPETTPSRLPMGGLPSAPAVDKGASIVPVAAEDVSGLNNPHGFKSMAECLAHITELECNSHQALTNQLQKVQQRASELTIRNAALEEELSSYQAYMRDVVPQYKKQLMYMKQQLKVRAAGAAIAAQIPPGNPIVSNDDFKLPLIK